MGWMVNDTHWPLYPRERDGTHCKGGWVGSRAGLDGCGKSRPTGIRSPDRPARSQSLYRLRYPGPNSLPLTFNILHIYPFSNSISNWPTLHPHKKTGKIIVLCLSMFTFLEKGLCKCWTFTTRPSGAEKEILRIQWKMRHDLKHIEQC